MINQSKWVVERAEIASRAKRYSARIMGMVKLKIDTSGIPTSYLELLEESIMLAYRDGAKDMLDRVEHG